jgi:hypothetical protein
VAKAFFNALPSQSEPFVTGLTGAAAVPAPVPTYELSVTGATKILGETASAASRFANAFGIARFLFDLSIDTYAFLGPCQ